MASSTIDLLSNEKAFEDFISSTISEELGGLKVVHFKSDWSEPCKKMTGILAELKSDVETNNGVSYGEVNAEELPAISMKHNITAVPTVLLFANNKEIDRVDGLRKEKLTSIIKSYIQNPRNGVTAEPITVSKSKKDTEPLEERLKKLINKHEIMVFMKGNRQVPRCGFSKTLMGILQETELPFETFDILEDEEVRQGLKTYSNWQTYPQIYAKGELIGGLDIVKDLKESNELMSALKGEN